MLGPLLLSMAAAAPGLAVSLAPARAPQGSIVVVTVSASGPVESPVLVDGERRIPLEPAGGNRWSGLLGVDFESAPGKRELLVEGNGPDGTAIRGAATLRVVARTFAVQKLTVDPRFVEPPPEELERIERDRAAFARAFASSNPGRLFRGPFVRPAGGELRGNFGARRVYNGKTRSRHAGLDLAAPEGAPVTAPAAGRVALTGDFYFSGGSVVLDHGDGLFTMYFHLSRLDVKEGEAVLAGQALGAVGATGRATGPHLHWAARLSGARVDPGALLALPALSAPAAPGGAGRP